jgi:hypothetical protein
VKKSIRRAVLVTGTTAAMATLFAGTAFAAFPPPTDPSAKTFNLWGSNTIQDVFQGFTQGYSLGTNTYSTSGDTTGAETGSWDATNPNGAAPCDSVTPVTGGDTFQRPDGSGDGRNALSAAWSTKDTYVCSVSGLTSTLSASAADKESEVSGARSSSLPSFTLWKQANSSFDDLTFIPLAKDAVGVAQEVYQNGAGTAPAGIANLNQISGGGALTAIYTDTAYTQVSGSHTLGDVIPTSVSGAAWPEYVYNSHGATELVVPTLPQTSSGTRSFFLNALGGSFDASVVVEETGEEENDYTNDLSSTNIHTYLNSGESLPASGTGYVAIAPFSGAAAIEQNHFSGTSTLPSGLSTDNGIFPLINSESLTNGETGSSAAIGESSASGVTGYLQSGTPNIAYQGTLEGNFARYVWLALPTGEESALYTWAETTLESSTARTSGIVSAQQVWTDFGFVAAGSTVATNDQVETDWTN